ncbi:MAG: translation initiation factor IF-2, partial [Flavobacteriales bacterium]
MADNKKTYRINKVATEFNVSWKTIVEHLNQKGFEVEAKITAKLDDAMYQDLRSFYKKDKQAKEESQQLEINIRKDAKTQEIQEIKKPEPPKKEFTEESTVYIKDNSASKPNVPTPVVKTPEATAPIATPTAPTAKVEVPEVKTLEVKAQEVKAPEVPKVAENPKKVEKVVKANVVKAPEVKLVEPDSSSSLKVLGTIDLSFN